MAMDNAEGPRKRRARSVCVQCHDRKVKCDWERCQVNGASSCSNCHEANAICQLRPSGRLAKSRAVGPRHGMSSSQQDVSPTLRRLIPQGTIAHSQLEQPHTIVLPQTVPGPPPIRQQPVPTATLQSDLVTDMDDPPTASSGAAFLGETGIMPIFAPEARNVRPRAAAQADKSDLLPLELQDSCLETYTEYCWPWCPVLDSTTIQTSIESSPSALLINALALLGTRVRPPMVQNAGPAEYYRRAKMLFYTDQEIDHVVCLQSILLFYWWAPQRRQAWSLVDEIAAQSPEISEYLTKHNPNTVNKDAAWWWTGLAIKYAQQLGLHREPKTVPEVGGEAMQGLRRRIWWTLFVILSEFESHGRRLADNPVQARERLTSICQGRPCTINPEDCTVREPSLNDFPSPTDPRAHIFLQWVRLCGIIGRVGQHLSRTPGHSFPSLLACELINWIQELPSQLKLPIARSRTRPFSRDVHKLHLPYLTTITILHMNPSAQHLQHRHQPLPQVYTPAITAASCVARIFRDLLARGHIRFLGAIASWYVGVAIVALLSTQRIDHLAKSGVEDIRVLRLALTELASLWPTATIFSRGFERMKAFDSLDNTTAEPFPAVRANESNDTAADNPPATLNDVSGQILDEHRPACPAASNLDWMHGIDWRSYFPFATKQTSALVADILASEKRMDSFLDDNFWYGDPSLALQDIFNSENALDPLLLDSTLSFC